MALTGAPDDGLSRDEMDAILKAGGTLPPLANYGRPAGDKPASEPTDKPRQLARRSAGRASEGRRGQGAGGRTSKLRPVKNRYLSINTFCRGKLARKVGPNGISVWTMLWQDTKAETGLACIAQTQLAEMIGVSRYTVMRAIKDLIREGLVEVEQRGGVGGGKKRSSVYRVRGVPRQGRG